MRVRCGSTEVSGWFVGKCDAVHGLAFKLGKIEIEALYESENPARAGAHRNHHGAPERFTGDIAVRIAPVDGDEPVWASGGRERRNGALGVDAEEIPGTYVGVSSQRCAVEISDPLGGSIPCHADAIMAEGEGGAGVILPGADIAWL